MCGLSFVPPTSTSQSVRSPSRTVFINQTITWIGKMTLPPAIKPVKHFQCTSTSLCASDWGTLLQSNVRGGCCIVGRKGNESNQQSSPFTYRSTFGIPPTVRFVWLSVTSNWEWTCSFDMVYAVGSLLVANFGFNFWINLWKTTVFGIGNGKSGSMIIFCNFKNLGRVATDL